MKLSQFIRKTLEETEADKIDFDVRVQIEENELNVIEESSSQLGVTSVNNEFLPRIKFTIVWRDNVTE